MGARQASYPISDPREGAGHPIHRPAHDRTPAWGARQGAGAFVAALTLAVPLTLPTTALAWIAHRPPVGGLLLAGAIAAGFLLRRLTGKPRARAVA